MDKFQKRRSEVRREISKSIIETPEKPYFKAWFVQEYEETNKDGKPIKLEKETETLTEMEAKLEFKKLKTAFLSSRFFFKGHGGLLEFDEKEKKWIRHQLFSYGYETEGETAAEQFSQERWAEAVC